MKNNILKFLSNINIRRNEGTAGLLATMMILFSSLALILSFNYMVYLSKISARLSNDSAMSFYVSESGLEDALLRFKNIMRLPQSNPYTLVVGDGTTTLNIGDMVGGVRLITSDGNENQRFRKLSINYVTDPNQVGFYYGAQVGAGGLIMGNNSSVVGNVFSNGSIQGSSGTQISGTVKVASAGNSLDGISVGSAAYASWLKNCTVSGVGYYTASGGTSNCSATGGFQLSSEISPAPLPIPQSSITKWQNDAAAGGIMNGDYEISNGTTVSLGPKEINGNLILDNNSTLNVTGTIWVTGGITTNNGSKIKLDQPIYGSQGGLVLSAGTINIGNNSNMQGSGLSGSYLMLLSTAGTSSDAIDVSNNASAAIFYAPNSFINLSNGVYANSVTGYGINLNNNASLQYQSGLADTNFKSGPSGGWSVNLWQETQ